VPIRFQVDHADGADKMVNGDPLSRKSPVARLINPFPTKRFTGSSGLGRANVPSGIPPLPEVGDQGS
jgi:hypothetical protein